MQESGHVVGQAGRSRRWQSRGCPVRLPPGPLERAAQCLAHTPRQRQSARRREIELQGDLGAAARVQREEEVDLIARRAPPGRSRQRCSHDPHPNTENPLPKRLVAHLSPPQDDILPFVSSARSASGKRARSVEGSLRAWGGAVGPGAASSPAAYSSFVSPHPVRSTVYPRVTFPEAGSLTRHCAVPASRFTWRCDSWTTFQRPPKPCTTRRSVAIGFSLWRTTSTCLRTVCLLSFCFFTIRDSVKRSKALARVSETFWSRGVFSTVAAPA